MKYTIRYINCDHCGDKIAVGQHYILDKKHNTNYCSWKCVALDLNSLLNETALTDSSECKEEEIDFCEF